MRDLIAGRTALVISHRFSLARQADEIVVLEAGEVAECGTHRALVESNGPYARMFSAQADRYRR
jgi:ABC-type multidrug transport system fused ATPase/permease subunit